ncbi:MAG TPA: TonB C-terminal domain-containing protein [Verrucomicrobiae bacterium]|nr:TonB C-terminal domain-containing protein [Verrucomicrobiae bacterium]
MNRLQKKCFVASAGIHLLLGLILLIGPAFVTSSSKPDDLKELNFVPVKTVDDLMSGGGNPKAQPAPLVPMPQPQPAAAPPPPQPQPVPQPEPPKPREPEPRKETPPPKPEQDSADLVKPRKIEISTKLVTRAKESPSEKQAKAEAEARREAKALADARRRLARRLGQAADQLGSELSSGTTVELQGPGGGGVPYANFFAAIRAAYDRAWVLPDGVVDEDAVAVASVTIRRDGTVVSHRMIGRSGDHVVDDSVELTLERVTYAAPLPDSSTSDTRTVSIRFSVKTKRSLG